MILKLQKQLESKRYLYVGFMCHQVIEKILKALYSNIHDDIPPYTHNLFLLSDKCGLMKDMEISKRKFLDELQPLNIEARYPDYKNKIFKNLNAAVAKEILEKTRMFYKWIKDML